MSTQNGNGNLHAGSDRARMLKLLSFHESAAAAIRRTLELLDQFTTSTKQHTHANVIEEVLTLERARVHHRQQPQKTRPGKWCAENNARPERTRAFLAGFGSKPLTIAELRAIAPGFNAPLGSYLNHGFLKRHANGSLFANHERVHSVRGAPPMRFRLAQCVYPRHHAIVVMAINTPVEELTDRDAISRLRALLSLLTGSDPIPPWVVELGFPARITRCATCGTPPEGWRYEIAWTIPFPDWETAQRVLRTLEQHRLEDGAVVAQILDPMFDPTRREH